MKKFILRIFNKLKLLNFLNLTDTIEVNQTKIIIPINGSVGFNNLNVSEPWMVKVLTSLNLNTEEVFIDVGVNIGQTLIKFETIYPNMRYIGFEPNPNCVNYTELLIEKNKWINIDLIPSGITENTGLGILEFYTEDITDSSASIVKNYRQRSKVYKRNIVTLLDVLNVQDIWKNKKVSCIKIDVEGSELGVIKSFQDILKVDRPYLLVEVLPTYDVSNKERLNNQIEIESILYDLDYMIYRIYKNSNNELESIMKIDALGVHSNLEWCDYLFSPRYLNI